MVTYEKIFIQSKITGRYKKFDLEQFDTKDIFRYRLEIKMKLKWYQKYYNG